LKINRYLTLFLNKKDIQSNYNLSTLKTTQIQHVGEMLSK